MKARKKIIVISVSIMILLIAFEFYLTITQGKALLVIDSLINGKDFLYEDSEYEDTESPSVKEEVANGYFNNYHMKASKIDLSKMDKMIANGFAVDIPEQYWNLSRGGKRDYVGEIELYKLICEILTRPEINPENSDYILRPEYVYGSWFNEAGFARGASNTFDPYTEVVMNTTPSYWGPFSLHKSYCEQKQGTAYDARMYVYIPLRESKNMDADNRVLRVRNYELYTTIPDNDGIIGSTYDRIKGIDKYSAEIKKNIKFLGTSSNTDVKFASSRPSPEVTSDAVYTFCRKLRSAYLGKDTATLNPNYTESNANLNKLYQREIKNKTVEKYSDLCFLYGLQLNSGKIAMHQWGDSVEPQSDTTGTMPYIYLNILNKFGTLNVTDISGFPGWSKQGSLDSFITGKEKGKDYLANVSVTTQDNLISRIGARDTFDRAIANLRTAEPRYYEEFSWTSSYGLECIANGTMIMRGIEQCIEEIYTYQVSNNMLLDSNNNDAPVGVSEDVKVRYFGPAGATTTIVPPWNYKEPIMRHITHNFYCSENGYYCPYHSSATHYGIDYTYTNLKTGVPVLVDIQALMDGKISKVSNSKYPTSYNRFYGNSVFIEHTIGNQTYLTIYAHMQDGINFSPKDVGKEIKAGAKLGVQGTTGNSTGFHLHFGLKNITTGIFYDPEPLLNSLRYDYEKNLPYLDKYSAISPKLDMKKVEASELQAKLRGLDKW